MSDLSKMPEFEAFVVALAEGFEREFSEYKHLEPHEREIKAKARALLAALDAKPEPPKPAERLECDCDTSRKLRAERDALRAVDTEAIRRVAEEVYSIGALLKTPPPRDFYRLSAALRKAIGEE